MRVIKSLLLLAFVFISGLTTADTTKVLFLGNSYTYFNNMPSLLESIALDAGDTVYTESRTPGGRRISQHATDLQVFSLLRSKSWDYVVIQCQSQEASFPDNQVATEVLSPAKILVDSILASNPCAMPLFFMTWGRKNGDASNCAGWPPVCTYHGMDSIIRSNYIKMAVDNNAETSPVGAVWNRLINTYPSLELYNPDQSHPSYTGSMAAAYTFYTVLTRKNPYSSTYKGSLSDANLDSLQKAVKQVVFDEMSVYNIGENDLGAEFEADRILCEFEFTPHNTASNSEHLWQFGDGTESTLENPTHTYGSSGNYTVTHTQFTCKRPKVMVKEVSCNLLSVQDKKIAIKRIARQAGETTFRIVGAEKVEVYSLDGKSIAIQKQGENLFQLDATSGIIIFHVTNKSGGVHMEKVFLE